jgi:hypothetical protein
MSLLNLKKEEDMNFKSVVQSLSTITDLKRVASAYVIDYRNLSNDEVEEALIKTGPQYYFRDNVEDALNKLLFSEDRDERILTPIMIHYMLLHTDDFKIIQKDLTDAVINYEQDIINRSNDFLSDDKASKSKSYEFFKFVLEVAWERNDSVSADEKNLLNKIRLRLGITDDERNIIEASIGRFPLNENKLHSRDQIETVRRKLQSAGLLFCIRDDCKDNYDIIPDEVIQTLREILDIEIKYHGFVELMDNKHLKNKAYLRGMLEKAGMELSSSIKLTELQELCISYLKPSILLAGYTPRDGLDVSTLSNWCGELHLTVSGQKIELIDRIIAFYDNMRKGIIELEDERKVWFEFYENLASRNLEALRSQNIIVKDLECEKYFERATDYIFEELLMQKPLMLKGTEHADGMLSYQDKIVLWDNKSKEGDVNLLDHIKQFDRYIQAEEKVVPIFLVIGPSFTDNSTSVAMQYMLENDTVICLLTATDLKQLAIKWDKKANNGNEPFPLGYFKQPGMFNSSLVNI